MRNTKTTRVIIALIMVMAVSAGQAIAGEIQNNRDGLPVFLTSSYQNEFSWRESAGDYREPVKPHVEPQAGDASADISQQEKREALKEEKGEKGFKGDDYVDNVLEKLPYSKGLKATWNFIDGDTDIYVEGLRVDRGNSGVSYTTNAVPFMGEVDGLEMKAEIGEDSKLKLKSSHVPFVGKVDGLEFKSAVGEEQAVSIRYKVPLDRIHF